MNDTPGPEIQECVSDAQYALWQIISDALLRDGGIAMQAFENGVATVQIDLLFSRYGMFAEGYFHCAGRRTSLLSIGDADPIEAATSNPPIKLVYSRKEPQ